MRLGRRYLVSHLLGLASLLSIVLLRNPFAALIGIRERMPGLLIKVGMAPSSAGLVLVVHLLGTGMGHRGRTATRARLHTQNTQRREVGGGGVGGGAARATTRERAEGKRSRRREERRQRRRARESLPEVPNARCAWPNPNWGPLRPRYSRGGKASSLGSLENGVSLPHLSRGIF